MTTRTSTSSSTTRIVGVLVSRAALAKLAVISRQRLPAEDCSLAQTWFPVCAWRPKLGLASPSNRRLKFEQPFQRERRAITELSRVARRLWFFVWRNVLPQIAVSFRQQPSDRSSSR